MVLTLLSPLLVTSKTRTGSSTVTEPGSSCLPTRTGALRSGVWGLGRMYGPASTLSWHVESCRHLCTRWTPPGQTQIMWARSGRAGGLPGPTGTLGDSLPPPCPRCAAKGPDDPPPLPLSPPSDKNLCEFTGARRLVVCSLQRQTSICACRLVLHRHSDLWTCKLMAGNPS